jgi:hypothetical protein
MTESTAAHATEVPKKIACSEGTRCKNAVAAHATALQKWNESGNGTAEPLLKAGKQYKVSTALTGHKDGWLQCQHFCCDHLTEEAKAFAISKGEPLKTCVQAHQEMCHTTGTRDYTAYRSALESTGALKKPRKRALAKYRAARASMVSDRLGTTSGYHLWVPPLGTTCGYHLWVPPVGTTCGYHLWVPLVGTTCGYHLWVPPLGTTCGYHMWINMHPCSCRLLPCHLLRQHHPQQLWMHQACMRYVMCV